MQKEFKGDYGQKRRNHHEPIWFGYFEPYTTKN
jgi:hypothetical protein